MLLLFCNGVFTCFDELTDVDFSEEIENDEPSESESNKMVIKSTFFEYKTKYNMCNYYGRKFQFFVLPILVSTKKLAFTSFCGT